MLLVVESPKLIGPLAETAEVTLTLVHVPVATAPELPILAPKGGAVEAVIAVSAQVLSATPKTSQPVDWALLAQTRRVALVAAPVRPATLNRRYERTTGEPSTRMVVVVPWLVVGADAST